MDFDVDGVGQSASTGAGPAGPHIDDLLARAFGLMSGPTASPDVTTPQQAHGGRRIPLAQGKGLGGSSIDMMAWSHRHPADYDGWRQGRRRGLQPRPGKGWFPHKQPKRFRATYKRTGGVRHMFAALDLASGELFYRFRDRKRWPQFLDFCKQLRRRFPTGKLYLVCDNYGSHGKAEVTAWCATHDIELVFTPTNGSWLNWVECEFTAIRYFTLDGSDYPTHQAQETAIARYIRWRNKHAQPKRHFAIGSKIRQPDYLPLSA